jgi:spore coat polysaccharide biosynthesis protein SpsF (cytidylyltransferase family)
MKIGCLVSVREKATRLPKKVLLDIAGASVAQRLLERMRLARQVDVVILCTSTHRDDEVLVELARAAGFPAFRGSEDDKLDRYAGTCDAFGLDGAMVVDGDDLLCFPELIDAAARELRTGLYDCVYVTGAPLGAVGTGLTAEALRRVNTIKDARDTEVWGGYFIGSGYFKCKEIRVTDPLFHHPEIRLTLDYEEDYRLLVEIFSALGNRLDFASKELMRLLVEERPELVSINASAQAKYTQHLRKATRVKFKHPAQA